MRANRWRYGIGAGILLLSLVAQSGCSLFAPFYFAAVISGMDTRVPPKFVFPPPPEEQSWRIVVVTYADLGMQIEIGHVDRELNELVSRKLAEGFLKDRKNIEVIYASKLAKWQDEHPDWRSLEPAEIGRALTNQEGRGADFVICLEIENLRFYEDGPGKYFYRGRADISVSVVQVTAEGGELVFPPDYLSCEFPKVRPIPTSEVRFSKFRREFIRWLAQQISWYFLPHDSGEEFSREPF